MALSFGEKMDTEVNQISSAGHLYYFNGDALPTPGNKRIQLAGINFAAILKRVYERN
jgi:hypothetical protein